MQGTRLARKACQASVNDCMHAWSHYYKVREMQTKIDVLYSQFPYSKMWFGKLYAIAIRILFLHVVASTDNLVNSPNKNCEREFRLTMEEARELLQTSEGAIQRTWGKFFLWPLAIIGAVVTDTGDIQMVRTWLKQVSEKSNSSNVLIIKEILDKNIWSQLENPAHTCCGFSTQGLATMLNVDVVNNAVSTLSANMSGNSSSMLQ
jgi:hypothetical protein